MSFYSSPHLSAELSYRGEAWRIYEILVEFGALIIGMKRRRFLVLSLKLSSATVLSGAEPLSSSESEPDLVFGVIADPQYADVPTKGTRFYRQSKAKLKVSIEALNQHPLDFAVTLGDVIDRDFINFQSMMDLYEGLTAPHRLVLGNHDFSVDDRDKKRVMAALGMKKSYYSEVRGNWRMIYLDGTEVSTFRYPKGDVRTVAAEQLRQKLKNEGVVQALPWNGALSKVQMDWLKEELDSAEAKQQRVVVFNHYPVLPAGDAHNLWNAEALVQLLSSYSHVVAYMNGHHHAGNYAKHQGCHYVNFKGMVETETSSAYAVVKCFADRLEIDGFESEPDRQLPSRKVVD